MKCTLCLGKKTYRVGKGVTIKCPACKGSGQAKDLLTASVAQALAAKAAKRLATSPKVLRFTILGEPVPKGRPRSAIMHGRNGKAFLRVYTEAETEAYERTVRAHAQLAVNEAGWAWSENDRFSLVMRIVRKHYDAGGDIDNYEKAVMDAMNGIVYADDRHVRAKGTAFLEPDRECQRIEVEVRRFPKVAA